jgi:hypothetical protein
VVEAPQAEPTPEAPVATESEDNASVSFEELFKMRTEIVAPVADDEEDVRSKSKNKKGKKSVEYQYDEARGEIVGRKKHKRGDGGWEDD